MIYVALLRGINVGGKNKVDMKQLKDAFERAGMNAVETYINSGNIVFESDGLTNRELAARLEQCIEARFGFPVPAAIRSLDEMDAILRALPDGWSDDERMKSDVMFLLDGVSEADVFAEANIKPGIDAVIAVPGAVLWAVDRKLVTRSGKMKLVGTDVYRRMTIRNVNTTRNIHKLMRARWQR